MRHIVVVAPASHTREFDDVLAEFLTDTASAQVPVTIIEGGAERSDSVRCGLRALDRSCDVVLVHDAARALAPTELAERVLHALATAQGGNADAVVPAMPVTDTVKVAEVVADSHIERVVSTPLRASLRAVQTPQGFRRSALVAAHEGGLDATDDAGLIERAGGEVHLIAGDQLALKVTTPLDMVIAEHLLADSSESDPL